MLDSGVVESLSPVGAESCSPGREPGGQPRRETNEPRRGSNPLPGNDTPGYTIPPLWGWKESADLTLRLTLRIASWSHHPGIQHEPHTFCPRGDRNHVLPDRARILRLDARHRERRSDEEERNEAETHANLLVFETSGPR